jgi:Flp pilus assembly pilin Flp
MFRQRMSQRKRAWSGQPVRRLRVPFTHRDETGASLVEYALLLALIAVVAIGALVFLGHTVSNTLNNVGNDIAGGGGGTTTTTLANSAPAFTSSANVGFTDGTAGTFSVTASGNPAATIACTNCTGGGSGLPAGVNFTGGTGTATITATTGTDGDCRGFVGNPYTIHLTATNSVSSVNQTVTITMSTSGAFCNNNGSN